jgi:hypothetical protein
VFENRSYLGEFEAEFKKALARESGAQEVLFEEKNRGRKSCDTVPLIISSQISPAFFFLFPPNLFLEILMIMMTFYITAFHIILPHTRPIAFKLALVMIYCTLCALL